jgi:BirA family biotin operon repressor/biotin-[acetyl-CoA-carboxylase] ligase
MTDDFHGIASDFPVPFRLQVLKTTGSTNDELRALAPSGVPDGLVLLALHQTSGRGRRGAIWFSQPEVSLAFSILVRPQEPKALWPRLALAAGLAVAEALESFGPAATIKWPNDVWIHHRKVAGILVEAGADFAIVGIGINVNTSTFPREVADIATSLRIATTRDHPRSEVLGAIIHRFALRRTQLGTDFHELLDAVRQRCVLTGQRVSLTSGNVSRHGLIEGIGPGGELLLRTASGLECLIQADEIRLIRNPFPQRSIFPINQ